MKRASVNKLAFDYAIRRLVRYGSLTSSDIVRAVLCSNVAAIAVMKDIESGYSSSVIKNGKRLFMLKPHPSWLDVVTDKQLMNAIKNGASEQETGLVMQHGQGKKVELPIKVHEWHLGDPPDGVITQITKCLLQRKPVDHRSAMEIKYVGMKLGESAAWRRIVPIGLECVANQWRLMAHDLLTNDFTVKTYVLTRIVDYRLSVEPLPSKFRIDQFETFETTQVMRKITLNNRLTADQEKVIQKELGLNNGTLQIERRIEFEFLRRFGDVPVSVDAVWPIVSSIGDK